MVGKTVIPGIRERDDVLVAVAGDRVNDGTGVNAVRFKRIEKFVLITVTVGRITLREDFFFEEIQDLLFDHNVDADLRIFVVSYVIHIHAGVPVDESQTRYGLKCEEIARRNGGLLCRYA